MIHSRKDYDRIQDPSGDIPLDEPVFLIRGQDPAGWESVLYWLSIHAYGDGSGFARYLRVVQQTSPGNYLFIVELPGLRILEKAILIQAVKMRDWSNRVGHGPASLDLDQLRLF